MSPRISRIFLSILAGLNNAVVSTCPLISKSSGPFTKPLRDCFERNIYNYYHRHHYVPLLFLVLKLGLGTYLYFSFLLFLLCGPPGRQTSLFGRYSFFLFFFFFFSD